MQMAGDAVLGRQPASHSGVTALHTYVPTKPTPAFYFIYRLTYTIQKMCLTFSKSSFKRSP
jgi:hypothetical protein